MNEMPLHLKQFLYHVSGMENVKTRDNSIYKIADETEIQLDINVPCHELMDVLLSGVVFIHGGPLPVGMKPQPKDWLVYRSYGKSVAASGLVGISLNYRNTNQCHLSREPSIFCQHLSIFDSTQRNSTSMQTTFVYGLFLGEGPTYATSSETNPRL